MNITTEEKTPRWMGVVLWIAAVYNILWGAWVVLFPLSGFRALGMELPNYPQIWQCVGMIVGVYGVGYACAALNPTRHWPIVMVGLLGKVLGPLGFLFAVSRGELDGRFGFLIIANDVIWWIPFGGILFAAWKSGR